MRTLRFFLLPIVILSLWLGMISTALAANTTLVPCKDSPAFQQRRANAPDSYYYTHPFETYSSELLCGSDGLPHLPLDRLDRAVDVAIPFGIFFYVAGLIGWTGRAYLQEANKAKNPELLEIFIDLPLAMQSVLRGLLWPLLAVQELLSGRLTANDEDISISPR
jgi:photosystem I subunit III